MFDIFGESNLTRINTSAGASDIQKFKNSKKTKRAFKYLFETDNNNNLPYIEAIKKKVWGKKTTTKKDTAFTLVVCEIVLNPKHPKISVSDNSLKNRFNTYLVSFFIIHLLFYNIILTKSLIIGLYWQFRRNNCKYNKIYCTRKTWRKL